LGSAVKIAIASSGLGHVVRGIETWARDTAAALAERGVDVTLFAAGPVECGSVGVSGCGSGEEEGQRSEGRIQKSESSGQRLKVSDQRSEIEIRKNESEDLNPEPRTLNPEPGIPLFVIVKCWKRNEPATLRWARWMPGFTWRWGLKDGYGWEQTTFWRHLWPILRRERFDILHVQDPLLALWCRQFRRLGLVKTRVILAHGTEEPPEFLRPFEYIQHLAPWHLHQSRTVDEDGRGQLGNRWTAIPNFVDPARFHPGPRDAEMASSLGVPPDAFVVGCVAAVKKEHKRIDYLIREFAAWVGRRGQRTEVRDQRPAGGGQGSGFRGQEREAGSQESEVRIQNSEGSDQRSEAGRRESATNLQPSASSLQPPFSRIPHPFLLIAGARSAGSDELLALAGELGDSRIKILLDFPRERMPELYRLMNVFVLPSLFEMMPIAVLEALASGVPVIANRHPVLQWMVGEEAEEARGKGEGGMGTLADAATAAGGKCIDMARAGALVEGLDGLMPAWLEDAGRRARARAVRVFAKDVVIDQYIDYYRRVLADKR
jgi:glycosyltransferase involved in cell wall biosynthesis